MANGGKTEYMQIIVTSTISALFSALVVFLAVWFTAVEGQGDEYKRDREFILGSLERMENQFRLTDAAISNLQNGGQNQSIRLAEIRVELIEIRRTLERVEQRTRPRVFPNE